MENYLTLWNACTINPTSMWQVERALKKILKDSNLYAELSKEVGIPWYMIGAIHYRESNCDKSKHIANGDPLTADTVHVPKDLMKTYSPGLTPPYTFKDSFIASIKKVDMPKIHERDIVKVLCETEKWNGLGYQKRGVLSPYLWSYTDLYKSGKYIADGKYDPKAVDTQVGCAAIYRMILV